MVVAPTVAQNLVEAASKGASGSGMPPLATMASIFPLENGEQLSSGFHFCLAHPGDDKVRLGLGQNFATLHPRSKQLAPMLVQFGKLR